ncbi:Arginase/deacetylase [Ramaria rubella]|nr:Arginase/deacetylase [Ramaria rubella]
MMLPLFFLGITTLVIAKHDRQVPMDRHSLSGNNLNFAHPFAISEYWDGLVTFAYSKPLRCFNEEYGEKFDVAVLGAPFDTATSYRPGRISVDAFNVLLDVKVSDHLDVADCGDIPMVRTDNKVALRQLEAGARDLIGRESSRMYESQSLAKDDKFHPRILTLGGDHTITLPLLRSVAETYGPVSVIHFDSHIDTWRPVRLDPEPRLPGERIPVNHGTYFWFAHREGLLANNTNIHIGIRDDADEGDLATDLECGFTISYAEEIEDVGYRGIVKAIRDRVGDTPVYISVDIDVIDPGMAPATGTPEIGGFTTREMKKILQGLEGLKIVGADIVEVAPAYDTQSEMTQIAAANIGWHLLSLMAKTPLTI